MVTFKLKPPEDNGREPGADDPGAGFRTWQMYSYGNIADGTGDDPGEDDEAGGPDKIHGDVSNETQIIKQYE